MIRIVLRSATILILSIGMATPNPGLAAGPAGRVRFQSAEGLTPVMAIVGYLGALRGTGLSPQLCYFMVRPKVVTAPGDS